MQFYNAMAEHLLLNRLCSFKVATKVVTSILKLFKLFAMRTSILLLVLSVIIFAGCTSAYKTGQTPDDVYFSPPRVQDEYVKVQEKEENRNRNYDQDVYYDDYYLRMKTHDRYRWSNLDDDYYYQRRYSSSYYNCWCSNPWTPYTYWNYYYNPYGSKVLVDPKSTVYSSPRISNLHTYNSTQLTNNTYSNPKSVHNNSNSIYNQPRIFNNNSNGNNSATNSNTGNFLRSIFNGGSSSSSGSSGSSGSTTSPSSSGSSGSSGGSAPVRKF
jgi:hypothetical protein